MPLLTAAFAYIVMTNAIYSRFLSIYLRIKGIPFFLRLFTIAFGIGGPLFVFGSICPIGSYKINGQTVTFQEFLASRAALQMLGTGILVTTIALASYKRKKWSRHVIVTSFVFYYGLALFKNFEMLGTKDIFPVGIIIYLLIWYLYFKKSVIKYFGKAKINISEQAH